MYGCGFSTTSARTRAAQRPTVRPRTVGPPVAPALEPENAPHLPSAGVRMTTKADTGPIALDTPLLKAEEVAELLAVKRSTVFELSRRRIDPLPSVSIGRAKRFDRTAVSRWLEHQRSRPR